MKFYTPQSKNVTTVTWAVAFALVGTILMTVFSKFNVNLYAGPGSVSPYLGALYPLVMAGVPVLLLAGFVYALYSIAREESKFGRYQLAALMLIILTLAYLFSFTMFIGGLT